MNLIKNEEELLKVLESKKHDGVSKSAKKMGKDRASLRLWIKRRGVEIVFLNGKFYWLYKGIYY